jgi:hypothetical protein
VPLLRFFLPSFFCFPLIIIIPPLLLIHVRHAIALTRQHIITSSALKSRAQTEGVPFSAGGARFCQVEGVLGFLNSAGRVSALRVQNAA